MKRLIIRRLKWIGLGLLLILVLTLSSGTVIAASVATATAELDWDTLSLTNATINYYYDDSYAYAYDNGMDVWDYDNASGSTPPTTYAYAQVSDTWARGQTSPSLIEETVYARSLNYQYPYSSASAYREVYFTADSTGLVTAQINYLLSLLLSTDVEGEYAGAYTGYYIYLSAEGDSGYDEEGRWKWVEMHDGDDYSYSITGTTPFLELPFKEGETGYLYAYVYNDSYAYGVPVPGTILLLGSGLIGLVGLRKRFRES